MGYFFLTYSGVNGIRRCRLDFSISIVSDPDLFFSSSFSKESVPDPVRECIMYLFLLVTCF